MSNNEICRLLKNIAAAYTIKDPKKYHFQIVAYQKAAESIESSMTELKDLVREGKIETLEGVGPVIKSYLKDFLENGKSEHFESILNEVPAAVFPLIDIPSFGPKKAFRLVSEFNITDPKKVIDDIDNLAKNNMISPLAGFGVKSEQDIIQAIKEYRNGKTKSSKMLLPYAHTLAYKIIDYLSGCKDVESVFPLGSLRRRKPMVGDIDIACSSKNPSKVLDYFVSYPGIERIVERGERTSTILISSDRQVDLMVAEPEGFGALLQHFTGSKEHNIRLREYGLSKGLSLSDYGIRKGPGGKQAQLFKYKTEEQFYTALGMDWIPPELRENNGEIELALQHKLPKLVEVSDLKGDFHIHSSYPIEPSHDMGSNTMEEMLNKAIEMGYEYLAFSEHNPSMSRHTQAQIEAILVKRHKFIEHLRIAYKNRIHIVSMLEIDIQPSGSLALDDELLEYIDAAIVSIHSSFDMEGEQMTERVLKGLSHKKARILAHPTGRLLNQRPGFDLNWEKLFKFCRENNKVIEINSSSQRLDLPDNLVRLAINAGVILCVDTDSHSVEQMSAQQYGIDVARRGWATKDDILNTKSYNEFNKWLNGNNP